MVFVVKYFHVVHNYKLLWLLRKVYNCFNTLIFDTPLLDRTSWAENIIWAIFTCYIIWKFLQNLNTLIRDYENSVVKIDIWLSSMMVRIIFVFWSNHYMLYLEIIDFCVTQLKYPFMLGYCLELGIFVWKELGTSHCLPIHVIFYTDYISCCTFCIDDFLQEWFSQGHSIVDNSFHEILEYLISKLTLTRAHQLSNYIFDPLNRQRSFQAGILFNIYSISSFVILHEWIFFRFFFRFLICKLSLLISSLFHFIVLTHFLLCNLFVILRIFKVPLQIFIIALHIIK